MAERNENELDMTNICKCAVPEIFQREVAEVMTNINDCNTNWNTKRKITLEFTFHPFKDRTGATVEMSCKSKLAAVESVEGNVFFAADHHGAVHAYARDPHQAALFAAQQVETPKQ